MNHRLLSTLILPTLMLPSLQAAAFNLADTTLSTNAALDSSSIALNGTLHDTNDNTHPWVAQLFAGAGECVRFFITTTNFDAKVVVVSPDGTVYRDDASGGRSRPLVRIASAPRTGWYTVQVAGSTGWMQNGDFTMKYGRYNAGNPNCDNPSTPL